MLVMYCTFVSNEVILSRLGWLLPLTSKPFVLNLKIFGMKKYRSGDMYWVTFLWPWPKVMVKALLIKEKFPFSVIEWEPLIQSLQNLASISPYSWLVPYKIFNIFHWKLCFWLFFNIISNEFFKALVSRSNTVDQISGPVGPIEVKP